MEPRRRQGWVLILAGVTCWFFIDGFTVARTEILQLSEHVFEQAEAQHGGGAVARLKSWQQILASDTGKPDLEKLDVVNRFFNQLEFVDDILHWGKKDYWATPLEFLSTNGGDCEDFSVAKYFTLTALGLPADKVYLTYVKSVSLDQAHMVVTYYPEPGAEPLVLDNLETDIRPASQRPDLLPVFSFNGDGLWLAKQRGKGKRVGEPTRLKRWRELLGRIQIEKSSLGE